MPNNNERQTATVIIDTKGLTYAYAIRDALQLALKLDGHTAEDIARIFNQTPDVVKTDQIP